MINNWLLKNSIIFFGGKIHILHIFKMRLGKSQIGI